MVYLFTGVDNSSRRLDKSIKALLHSAKQIVEQKMIKGTEDKNIFLITLPDVTPPISCRINWNKNSYLCTCGNQQRQCAHLIASLSMANHMDNMEDLFQLTNPLKGQVKGARKRPCQNYFQNPANESAETGVLHELDPNNKKRKTDPKLKKGNFVENFLPCCLRSIEENDDVIECQRCKTAFHEKCVKKTKKEFVCVLCSIKTKGLRWGEGAVNTCPMDSTLQIILTRYLHDPDFAKELATIDYGNKRITQAMGVIFEKSRKDNTFGIQKTWADINGIGDLYGTTTDIFWKHLKSGGAFKCEVICSKCRSESTDKSEVPIVLKEKSWPLQQNVDFLFNRKERAACGICKNANCKGQKLMSSYKPLSKNTWFCVLDTERVSYRVKEFFNIQDRLQFGDDTFTLAGFVVFNRRGEKCTNFVKNLTLNNTLKGIFLFTDHFYSFIKVDGILLHYDGAGTVNSLGKTLYHKRIQFATPEIFNDTRNRKIHEIVYLKSFPKS